MAKANWLAAWNGLELWKRVLGGLALGVIVGLALRYSLGPENAAAFTTAWFRPLGDTFVQLIRMLVVPLIFTTLVAGILAMGEPSKLGTIGVRTLGVFLFTAVAAVTIGIILGAVVRPGAGVTFAGVEPGALPGEQETVVQRLINVIPENPIAALASGDVLAIIFFAILLGIALLYVGTPGKPLADVIVAGSEVMMKITHGVMQLAPFGVFFLIAWVAASNGLSTFVSVGKLALCVYLGCAVQIALIYGGVLKFGARLKLRPFFRGVFDAQAVAYSTSSSNATLPVTLACVRDNLGVPPHIAGSVVSLGATVNMDGTALYLGVLALFAAQAFGFDLTLLDYVLVALTAALAAVGTAGIPSVSLFLLATVLSTIGATPEQTALMVGFILPFDRPLDMMRTLTNVTGDAVAAVAVARWEGELDQAAYEADDRL